MQEQLLIVEVKCKMHKNYSLYYKFHGCLGWRSG